LRGHAIKYAGNHVSLALHRADHRDFLIVVAFLFVPMAVFVFAAHKSFIHLDNAAKLFFRLHHR
jgi:hypothetical protein